MQTITTNYHMKKYFAKKDCSFTDSDCLLIVIGTTSPRAQRQTSAKLARNQRKLSAKSARNEREKHHVTTDNINNNNKIKNNKIYSRKTVFPSTHLLICRGVLYRLPEAWSDIFPLPRRVFCCL